MRSDPRINRKGRPRSFDELRKLAQAIANETTTDTQGNKITTADALLGHGREANSRFCKKRSSNTSSVKSPTNSKRIRSTRKRRSSCITTTNDQGDGEKQVAGYLQKFSVSYSDRESISLIDISSGRRALNAGSRLQGRSSTPDRPTNLPLTDGALLNVEHLWRRFVELRAHKRAGTGVSS